jgi:two-component system, sensor histidine kinase and response regulator
MTNAEALDPAVIQTLRQLSVPGEPDVLREVLTLFLDEVPRRIARLNAACQDGNAIELQRGAHSLKGSSGNIGARRMFDLCRQVDERGHAGDFKGARHLLASLAEEYHRVEAEIRQLLQTS